MIKKTETKTAKTSAAKKTKAAPVKEEKKQTTKTRPVKPATANKAKVQTANLPTMDTFPSVKKGDNNGYVTLLQTNLKNRGYYEGKVDGKFGDKTEKALNEFQKDAKKPQNATVGGKTWALLQKSTIVKLKAEPPKADIQPQQPSPGVSVVVEGLTRYQADLLVKLFQGNTACHII